MENSSSNWPDGIAPSGLLPALQALFESDNVIVCDWELNAPGMHGTTGADVKRLRGTATVRGQLRTWSLIRKVLASPTRRGVVQPARTEMPSGINYWKREFHAYQSELLGDLLLRSRRRVVFLRKKLKTNALCGLKCCTTRSNYGPRRAMA